jgi:hypothetical protein
LESRSKKSGKRNSALVASSLSKRTIPKFLECTVVPEQPLLRIRWSSLIHGAVMLYNGEKYDCRSAFPGLLMTNKRVWQIYASAHARKRLKFARRLPETIV